MNKESEQIKDDTYKLLKRLAERRKELNIFDQRLFKDEEANKLIYKIAEINNPFLLHIIKEIKKQFGKKESIPELKATAFVGYEPKETHVKGFYGAIMHYDVEKYGMDSFTDYIARAIRSAFIPSEKSRKNYKEITKKTQYVEGYEWAPRVEHKFGEAIVNAELMGIVDNALNKMGGREKEICAHIIKEIRENGKRPTIREMGEILNVNKSRAAILMANAVNKLVLIIKEDYPTLEVNTWEFFRDNSNFGYNKD